MAEECADRCPYPRPFSRGFTDCPAYQLTSFVALDTSFQPLEAVNSCSHLRLRERPSRVHRYYAACRIGDEAQRQAWVDLVSTRRLLALRGLQEEMVMTTTAEVAALFAAKSEQVRHPSSEAGAALGVAAGVYMGKVERLIRQRAAALAEADMPLEACIDLIRVVLELWRASPRMEAPEVPGEILARFPPETRALIEPPHAAA